MTASTKCTFTHTHLACLLYELDTGWQCDGAQSPLGGHNVHGQLHRVLASHVELQDQEKSRCKASEMYLISITTPTGTLLGETLVDELDLPGSLDSEVLQGRV